MGQDKPEGQMVVSYPEERLVSWMGRPWRCVMAVRGNEWYGDWVVLKRKGKVVDVLGAPARLIMDLIKEDEK